MAETALNNSAVNNALVLSLATQASPSTLSTADTASTISMAKTNSQSLTALPPSVPFAQTVTGGGAGGNSEAPPLEDVEGPMASGTQAASSLPVWLTGKTLSFSEAIKLLGDLASDQMLNYGKMKNLYGNNQYLMAEQSAKLLQQQVKGERESAGIKLGGSLLAAGLAFGIGYKGGQLQFSATDKYQNGQGAALMALGQTVGGLVNNATDAFDKLAGGAYKADQAKMQKAIVDIFVSLYKSQEDSLSSGYDERRKNLQSTFDLIRSVTDGNNQAVLGAAANT